MADGAGATVAVSAERNTFAPPTPPAFVVLPRCARALVPAVSAGEVKRSPAPDGAGAPVAVSRPGPRSGGATVTELRARLTKESVAERETDFAPAIPASADTGSVAPAERGSYGRPGTGAGRR
ncbi:hypothetical protein ACIBEA_21510 [Streptomyces sp. NPDC051555]|uniref:hypothetical protein n=1 Tax=Streptomyces sp. NPDC051555 TaxID=3365657 RepID=UPI0037876842